ncbi:hypothetical protein [Baekduia alba]|uniref:hypothetical protein n=1 Tax=Baekduia alba TaxID=2997333 RepID=UPI00234045A7|nr:hypothetical protein [Baekduia alba]
MPTLLLSLACGAATAFAATAQQPPTALVTLGGEQLTHPSKAARVIQERSAEGGHTMMLSARAALTGDATLGAPADHLALRVRAKRCGGAPVLRVSVDHKLILNRRIAFTRYRTLAIRRALAAGPHRVTISMSHALARRGCKRRLYVDTVALTTTARIAPGDGSSTDPGTIGGALTTPGTGTTTPGGATTTTGTTPTGTGGGATPGGGTLRWPAPALVAPTTIAVADGDQWYTLDNARDYIIKLPSYTHNGSLGIEGGRNVVVMGGHIKLPANSGEDAALQLRSNAGTVHVEGLWIDGSTGYTADAIRISAPAATVQLENVRASSLRGSAAGSHTDVVQPYGGVKDLRVDHLSADSNYQGIFAKPDLGPIGTMELSNVDLAYDDVGAADGGYLLWLSNGCSAPVTTLSNVYVKPSASKLLGTSVWPNVYDAGCPAKVTGNTASWPKLPVTGSVTGGTPPGGPFVSSAAAGAVYTSPGYR